MNMKDDTDAIETLLAEMPDDLADVAPAPAAPKAARGKKAPAAEPAEAAPTQPVPAQAEPAQPMPAQSAPAHLQQPQPPQPAVAAQSMAPAAPMQAAQLSQLPHAEPLPFPERPRRQLSQMMRKIPVRLTLEVGSATVSLHDLMGMAQDSVVELDTLAGESLVIKVNGTPIGRAEVVVAGENYGLKIIDLDGLDLDSLTS